MNDPVIVYCCCVLGLGSSKLHINNPLYKHVHIFSQSIVKLIDVMYNRLYLYLIVLFLDSRVYSWGRNNYCQLGHSRDESVVYTPKQVKGLESLPIKKITAGGAHNFALSLSGNAFGWGRNRSVYPYIQ